MDSILKLHKNNINQLKGHILANGASVIHGDGNIYPAKVGWTPEKGEMNHSYNNAEFSNPDREEATYFKTYNTIAEVPGTVEELEQQLIANRFKTAALKRSEQTKVTSNTFAAYDEPVKETKSEAKAEPKEKEKAEKATPKETKSEAKAEPKE